MSTLSGIGNASSAWSQVGTSRASDRKERLFAKADGNGDGKVDAAELQALLDQGAERSGSGTAPNAADLMTSADADGSGGLDADELDAGLRSLAPAAGSTVEFAHQHRGPPPSDDATSRTDAGATSDLTTRLQDLFEAADGNGDGRLDSGELSALRANIDTALRSLESGSAAATGDSGAAASGDVSRSDNGTGSTPTDSARATGLELTQLVLKEYASNAASASASSAGSASAISLTA